VALEERLKCDGSERYFDTMPKGTLRTATKMWAIYTTHSLMQEFSSVSQRKRYCW